MFMIDHEAVLQCANRLPPLPQSASRLVGLLAADEPDLHEIVRAIEYDPPLTMKLLRVANSALGSSRREVGSVREALVRLGTGTVAGVIVGTSVRSLIGKRIPGYDLSESDFWRHSLAAAFAAESIQAHSLNWHGQLAFTAAILHDIGKLVLGQFLNVELSTWLEQAIAAGNQPAFRAEKEILSMHHGEVGGLVAQHWGLPDCLVKGIAYHHEPEAGAEGIGYATYLADLVAHRLDLEQRSGTAERTDWDAEDLGPALTWLGLAERHLVQVCEDARKGLRAVSGRMD